MAEVILRTRFAPIFYARVDSDDKVSWRPKAADATGFSTEKEALETVERVAVKMKVAGEARLKKALEKGTMLQHNDWRERKDCPEGRAPTLEDYVQKWVLSGLETMVESRAQKSDLLDVFGVFYVRSELGWLGIPSRKSANGRREWGVEFHQASSFLSAEAAKSVADGMANWPGTGGVSILKASAVFTEVLTPKKKGERADDVSMMISSACDTRGIEESISEAANMRRSDFDSMGRDASEEKAGAKRVAVKRASPSV